MNSSAADPSTLFFSSAPQLRPSWTINGLTLELSLAPNTGMPIVGDSIFAITQSAAFLSTGTTASASASSAAAAASFPSGNNDTATATFVPSTGSTVLEQGICQLQQLVAKGLLPAANMLPPVAAAAAGANFMPISDIKKDTASFKRKHKLWKEYRQMENHFSTTVSQPLSLVDYNPPSNNLTTASSDGVPLSLNTETMVSATMETVMAAAPPSPLSASSPYRQLRAIAAKKDGTPCQVAEVTTSDPRLPSPKRDTIVSSSTLSSATRLLSTAPPTTLTISGSNANGSNGGSGIPVGIAIARQRCGSSAAGSDGGIKKEVSLPYTTLSSPLYHTTSDNIFTPYHTLGMQEGSNLDSSPGSVSGPPLFAWPPPSQPHHHATTPHWTSPFAPQPPTHGATLDTHVPSNVSTCGGYQLVRDPVSGHLMLLQTNQIESLQALPPPPPLPQPQLQHRTAYVLGGMPTACYSSSNQQQQQQQQQQIQSLLIQQQPPQPAHSSASIFMDHHLVTLVPSMGGSSAAAVLKKAAPPALLKLDDGTYAGVMMPCDGISKQNSMTGSNSTAAIGQQLISATNNSSFSLVQQLTSSNIHNSNINIPQFSSISSTGSLVIQQISGSPSMNPIPLESPLSQPQPPSSYIIGASSDSPAIHPLTLPFHQQSGFLDDDGAVTNTKIDDKCDANHRLISSQEDGYESDCLSNVKNVLPDTPMPSPSPKSLPSLIPMSARSSLPHDVGNQTELLVDHNALVDAATPAVVVTASTVVSTKPNNSMPDFSGLQLLLNGIERVEHDGDMKTEPEEEEGTEAVKATELCSSKADGEDEKETERRTSGEESDRRSRNGLEILCALVDQRIQEESTTSRQQLPLTYNEECKMADKRHRKMIKLVNGNKKKFICGEKPPKQTAPFDGNSPQMADQLARLQVKYKETKKQLNRLAHKQRLQQPVSPASYDSGLCFRSPTPVSSDTETSVPARPTAAARLSVSAGSTLQTPTKRRPGRPRKLGSSTDIKSTPGKKSKLRLDVEKALRRGSDMPSSRINLLRKSFPTESWKTCHTSSKLKSSTISHARKESETLDTSRKSSYRISISKSSKLSWKKYQEKNGVASPCGDLSPPVLEPMLSSPSVARKPIFKNGVLSPPTLLPSKKTIIESSKKTVIPKFISRAQYSVNDSGNSSEEDAGDGHSTKVCNVSSSKSNGLSFERHAPVTSTQTTKKRGRPRKHPKTTQLNLSASSNEKTIQQPQTTHRLGSKLDVASALSGKSAATFNSRMLQKRSSEEDEERIEHKPKITPKLKAEAKLKTWRNDSPPEPDPFTPLNVEYKGRKRKYESVESYILSEENNGSPQKSDSRNQSNRRYSSSSPSLSPSSSPSPSSSSIFFKNSLKYRSNELYDNHNFRITSKQLDDVEKKGLRVLISVGGLLRAGELTAVRAPDLYGIRLDGERGQRLHIYTKEEVLHDVVLEVKSEGGVPLRKGTRVCAFWSSQYLSLYPGFVTSFSSEEEDESDAEEHEFTAVQFDDGDSGRIRIDHIRLLPNNFSSSSNQYETGRSWSDRSVKKRRISSLSHEEIPIDKQLVKHCPESGGNMLNRDGLDISDKSSSSYSSLHRSSVALKEKSDYRTFSSPTHQDTSASSDKSEKKRLKKKKKEKEKWRESSSCSKRKCHKHRTDSDETTAARHKRHKHKHKHHHKRHHKRRRSFSKPRRTSINQQSMELDYNSNTASPSSPLHHRPTIANSDTTASLYSIEKTKNHENQSSKLKSHQHHHHHHHHHHRHHHHHQDEDESNKTGLEEAKQQVVSSMGDEMWLPKSKHTTNHLNSESQSNCQQQDINVYVQQTKVCSSKKKEKETEQTKMKTAVCATSSTPVAATVTVADEVKQRTKTHEKETDNFKEVEIVDEENEENVQLEEEEEEEEEAKNSEMCSSSETNKCWEWFGKGVKRNGKGRAKKEFFKSIKRDTTIINVGDCAVFVTNDSPTPFIGRIESMWESCNSMMVRVNWFYHPEETTGLTKKLPYPGGLFESPHEDKNEVQTISHKCDVVSLEEYKRRLAVEPQRLQHVYQRNDLYFMAGFYDPTNKRLTLDQSFL